jgi:hypothetical protein
MTCHCGHQMYRTLDGEQHCPRCDKDDQLCPVCDGKGYYLVRRTMQMCPKCSGTGAKEEG